MIAVVRNLYTRGTELKDLDGLNYIGYYHINNSGSIMSESDYVPGVSKKLVVSNAVPENAVGDVISRFDDDTDTFEGDYVIIPVKNYKNDIDLPSENIELEEPDPVTITDQPDVFFKRVIDNVDIPGLEVFIDESNVIQVVKGTSITLQFGYESADNPSNIKFEWFDSFDRVISTDPILVVNTTDVEPSEETYYCTITDSFGSDTTNEITINVVDSRNPFLYKNIIKNGSGNNSTADWETVGDNPEEVGKFLHTWLENTDPFTSPSNGRGTYFYHKNTTGWDNALPNKNQWYPRPEIFDEQNGFSGSIVSEIKENYLRAGVFTPIVRAGENNYSGLSKTSIQIIDLEDAANIIDGKVYGITGVKALLFGWVGTRADQADYGECYFEFLDENDAVIPDVAGNTSISSLRWFQRVVNDYPKESWFSPIDVKIMSGFYDSASNFDYSGMIYDGNVGVLYDRYNKTYSNPNGSVQTSGPEIKTCIVGRNSDTITVPRGTRKIRVTKSYKHEAGLNDLFWDGDNWQERGIDYISDLMFVGLNLRLYPLLVDENNVVTDTSLKPDGSSIISGMKFLEEYPATDEISKIAQQTLGGQSLDAFLNSQELRLESIEETRPTSGEPWFMLTMHPDISIGVDQTYKSNEMQNILGKGWAVYGPASIQSFVRRIGGDRGYHLNNYAFRPGPDGVGTITGGTSHTGIIVGSISGKYEARPDFKEILFPRDENGEEAYDNNGVRNPDYLEPYFDTILVD